MILDTFQLKLINFEDAHLYKNDPTRKSSKPSPAGQPLG